MSRLTATHITIIICTLIAGIVALALFDKDTAALTAGILAVAGALGLSIGQTSDIKTNLNGRLDRVLTLAEEMAHRAIDEAKNAPPPVDRQAA